jgi:hypothetical protein
MISTVSGKVCGGIKYYRASGKCMRCVSVNGRAGVHGGVVGIMEGFESDEKPPVQIELRKSFADQIRLDRIWRPTAT